MIYLSVVIPIRNEERFIADTLISLINQEYPRNRFELLIVDGRSTDRTREVVEGIIGQYPEVAIRLLDNPGILSSCARNIGIRGARGKLICVIDGHVSIPDRLLFRNMERLKDANSALCLSRPAPLDVPGLTGGKPYWIAIARKSWLGHSTKSFIYSEFAGFVDPMSAGFAYDRTVFDKVGYFDESFDAAEDVEFHFRLKQAGILSYTAPDLLIYSFPRESLAALLRQQIRYGEGRARLVKKHPDAFTKETLVPVGIFLVSILTPLALVLWPLLASPASGILILFFLYASTLLITGFVEAAKRGRLFPAVYVALAIWTTHFGLGYGFLRELLCHKR
jgi:glycosyltransferase involved in cell wall biosynthesis